MKFTIAVMTHNEKEYLKTLLDKLLKFVDVPIRRDTWDIVIVDDFSEDMEVQHYLFMEVAKHPQVTILQRALAGDFSAQKNFLTENCKGDWIINLDADEDISTTLLADIPLIIESNPAVEAYWVPRINIVDGLTLEHVHKWSWTVGSVRDAMYREVDGDVVPSEYTRVQALDPNSAEYKLLKVFQLIDKEEDGFVYYRRPMVCWPDYQMRIYKKDYPRIHWINKVHERIVGYDQFTYLPDELYYSIVHIKDIERQERQNEFYDNF